MCSLSGLTRFLFSLLIVTTFCGLAIAQKSSTATEPEFGPVMTAYLGYLSNEQEVVDDRASRKEISAAYYRRNSNRINALREMATRLVRQSENDYVPELEAVTLSEMGTIFERPPRPSLLRPNEVVSNRFRFLGQVNVGETFYLFARLDPYEQAELIEREGKGRAIAEAGNPNGQRIGQSRARKVLPK
jgi:hypothetical protein